MSRKLLVTALLLVSSAAGAATNGFCRPFFVPVAVPAVPGARVYGELCLPLHGNPKTVQFLVHGSTFNHFYWDWPLAPRRYSHVEGALDAGYATFNIDRLGTGWSSKPQSELVTLDVTIDVLHQLAADLKAGAIGGRRFEKVVYFGSSLSTVYGWLLAERHPADIDAFVLTGLVHLTRPTWLDRVFMWHVDPACTDPKFEHSGVDCGYVTTTPWKRDQFFWYVPGVRPVNLILDELLKDIVSGTLLFESAAFVLGTPTPELSPSRTIAVPTLVAFGELDNTACGPDGITCSEATVRALEEPFYAAAPVLDFYVPAGTGHALPIHESGEETTAFINDWIDRNVGTR